MDVRTTEKKELAQWLARLTASTGTSLSRTKRSLKRILESAWLTETLIECLTLKSSKLPLKQSTT
jgi:hypothetical protein